MIAKIGTVAFRQNIRLSIVFPFGSGFLTRKKSCSFSRLCARTVLCSGESVSRMDEIMRSWNAR